MDLTDAIGRTVERGSDASPVIYRIADQPFVTVLQSFDKRLARVSAAIVNGNGTTVERLGCVVRDFSRIDRVFASIRGIDEELASGHPSLEERKHGGLTSFHRNGF